MFDAKRLLDQFMGQGVKVRSGEQPDAQRLPGGPGNLQSLLGGGGGNLQSLLGGKGGDLQSLLGGGFGKGAIAGGLAGLLLGGSKPQKLAKSALTYGGLAVVGGLAYKAWRDWQEGKPPAAAGTGAAGTGAAVALAPPPADTAFRPDTPEEEQNLSLAVLRAMIAAAKADGHIDADEQQRIFARIEVLDLDQEGKAFVLEELGRPLDIDAVAKGARTPEQAAEIYAASLLAIEADDAAETGYLTMLAARLKLDPKLVEHLHAQVRTAAGSAVQA